MAITIPDDATLAAQVLAYFRTRFPDKATGDTSFLGKFARAVAMALLGLQKAVADADNDSTPNTKTSSLALDSFGVLFGISNGANGYGRKQPTASTGGAADCTGVNGTIFPDNSLLTASDGTTIVYLSGAVTIPGIPPDSGSAEGVFIGQTTGTVGNLPIGSVLTWQSPPSGGDSTVTLTSALAGGLDIETDADLLSRILERLQSPPKGGTSSDYRAWAESVAGIHRAYVYPLREGIGSVNVVLTSAGSGSARDPGATVKTNVDDYIDEVRPVTVDGYTSFRPYMPGNGMTIRARAVPSLSKYNFDWTEGSTYTIAGYAAGPPAVVTFNTAVDDTLIAAIDLAVTAGTEQTTGPRIQVGLTGGPAIPVQVRCVAYNGGHTQITLQTSLPDEWVAPTNGDKIYAGGPIVDITAQNILDYVDTLGPSRYSGKADSLDLWEDTCAIFKIAQIVLDSVDTDDITRLSKNIVSGGITIDGAATDVQATDNSVNGPELLRARWIFVTQ